MAEAATAVLALWNDVAADMDAAYNDWHAREHVPERLTVPGMLWGLRYGRVSGAMPRYLTLYGLRDLGVLESEAYQRLLAEPTPASRRMRPALQNLSRWVCRVRECRSLDAGTHLSVLPLDARHAGTGAAIAASLAAPSLGGLMAERVAQAVALPWLQQGQARPVDGDTLVCLVIGPTPAVDAPGLPEGTGLYRRL